MSENQLKRKRPIQRLKKKLKKELNIEIDETSFKRTYAGFHMKQNGDWVWSVNTTGDSPKLIGSGIPVRDLIRKQYLLKIDEYNEIYT
ncbi:MAG: hypothetical protein Q4P17_04055 [Methanobacterium sp.]|nr:hypothetical protein [Methanobacterium sp.]